MKGNRVQEKKEWENWRREKEDENQDKVNKKVRNENGKQGWIRIDKYKSREEKNTLEENKLRIYEHSMNIINIQCFVTPFCTRLRTCTLYMYIQNDAHVSHTAINVYISHAVKRKGLHVLHVLYSCEYTLLEIRGRDAPHKYICTRTKLLD